MIDRHDRAAQRALLTRGEIEIEGRMPWSSNATFLVNVGCDDDVAQAIYKPTRGERPLWDFEPGLHRRELAAYVLSEAMDLDLVPPTIIRDGPSARAPCSGSSTPTTSSTTSPSTSRATTSTTDCAPWRCST